MTSFEYALSDLKIPVKYIPLVFSFENDICTGINAERYKDIIHKEIQEQFPLTVNTKCGNGSNKYTIVIRLYCALKKCPRKFKLKIKKEDVTLNSDGYFSFVSTHLSCDHDEKIIRQLRGNERKEIASLVKSSSVSSVRSDAIKSANYESLLKGNMQKVFVKPVLRKAVSELNCESDQSPDTLYDLFLRANKMKFVYNIEYKSERFNITILSTDQIKMLNKYVANCQKNNEVSRIYYDATGGMCKSPANDIKTLFHHTIVIPLKCNEIDSNYTLLNIGEMISALHTSQQQDIFLRRFMHLAKEPKKSGN